MTGGKERRGRRWKARREPLLVRVFTFLTGRMLEGPLIERARPVSGPLAAEM